MRTLWNMLSFLAMVNMLALLIFAGWLVKTGRLDRDRLHELRDLLSTTIADQQASEAERRQASEEAGREQADAARRASPELVSDARIRQISRVEEQERLARRRLDDTRQLVQQQIGTRLEKLEQERTALDAEAGARAGAADVQRAATADEQLAKTVATLEAVPPKLARDVLAELVGRGETAQAVAYLDRMKPRSRAKIIKEFKEQPELATELLEELRTLGLDGPGSEEPGNAVDPVDTD